VSLVVPFLFGILRSAREITTLRIFFVRSLNTQNIHGGQLLLKTIGKQTDLLIEMQLHYDCIIAEPNTTFVFNVVQKVVKRARKTAIKTGKNGNFVKDLAIKKTLFSKNIFFDRFELVRFFWAVFLEAAAKI